MDPETPDYSDLLDKEMGGAPSYSPNPESDKVQAEPVAPVQDVPADKADAPAPEPDPVDADLILMRADYTKAKMRLAEDRRELERKAQEVADLQAVKQRIETDEQFRARLQEAWQDEGQAASQPAPNVPVQQMQDRIARLEGYIADQHRDSHASLIEAAADRIVSDFKLTEKDREQIILKAVNADLLDYGTKKELIDARLRMVTAEYLLPRAKADGQRELIGQIKDKGKLATPVTEHQPPPEAEPDVTKMKQQEYEDFLVKEAEKAIGKS
jgi:hypothetical protein